LRGGLSGCVAAAAKTQSERLALDTCEPSGRKAERRRKAR
jgi:Cdc6-like AAA superfamily ATPase